MDMSGSMLLFQAVYYLLIPGTRMPQRLGKRVDVVGLSKFVHVKDFY
jgi:hypothetical protein